MKNLSPKAKRILMILAQDEARKIGSEKLLPEHVLLALLNMKDGLGYQTLEKLGLDIELLKDLLIKSFEGEIKNPTLDTIPKSRRYQFMMDIADIESSALHNDYIGTEHILLAAVRDEDGVAYSFFQKSGYNIMDARFTVME